MPANAGYSICENENSISCPSKKVLTKLEPVITVAVRVAVCGCVSLVMSAARSYVVYSSAAAQQMLTFFLYFRVLIMLEFNEMMIKKFVLRPILQMPRLLPQHLLKERIIQISLKVLF